MSQSSWKGSPYVVTSFAIFIAVAMFSGFSNEASAGWNLFLGVFLSGLVIASFFLARHLSENFEDVGEATFTKKTGED